MSLKALITICAAVFVTGVAHAQTSYVLYAPGWGSNQNAAVAAAGGEVRFSHDGAGVAVVESSNPQFLSQVRSTGAITGGAVDQVVQWTRPETTVDLVQTSIDPSDDRFFNTIQWAPQAVSAPQAWEMGYTGKGVRIAVIDGGIYAAHPDLAGNVDVAAGRSFVPGPHGSCQASFDCDIGDFWHGTHVAGIIAAEDNSIGVVGIAPNATIVPVKALHYGFGSFASIIQAILYAATDGHADIINMSLGATFPVADRDAAQLVKAFNKAVNFASSNGTLVISSAGNDSTDLDHNANSYKVPAQSGNGLAVSATGPVGFAKGETNFSRFASYSNYGTSVINVAAPGGDFAYQGSDLCTLQTTTDPLTRPCWAFDMVLSTSRAGYTWAAGTSMAAPAASAIAALIKERFPNISVGELKNRLMQSADDLGANGVDPYYGRGFVNAYRAVTY